MTVTLGFLTAGYLINDSSTEWQDSPVSTSIETEPLKELTFPTVTVCPPKDSHTALNYDLMKTENDSLTKEDRDFLNKVAFDLFI